MRSLGWKQALFQLRRVAMFEKRKDSRGRILKDGESQRKNGSYMYRYTDIHKKAAICVRKYIDRIAEAEGNH